MRGLEFVFIEIFFDLFTTVCTGRERVTARVTDRNGSGDFDTVELERMDLLVVGEDDTVLGFVEGVKCGERNGKRGERD